MKQAFVLLLLLTANLHADAPVASYLFPAGGQRGTSPTFLVGGLNLHSECQLEMTGQGVEYSPTVKRVPSPFFEGPILPLPESQRQEDYPRTMAATAKISTEAPLGDRFVFCRTSQGYTAPRRFVIGDLPEIVETERDGIEPATLVSFPVTINGRIYPREDVDQWAVSLKKGERLTVHVDAGRLGYLLEAKITLKNPDGQPLAEAVYQSGVDPSLSIIATQDGQHTCTITDAKSDGGPAYVYRLTLSREPIHQGLSPYTENLPRRLASDQPDVIRGNLIAIPGVGEGLISKPNEQQTWTFNGTKNEPIEFKLYTRSIGSKLLGSVHITDLKGKELHTVEATTDADFTWLWTPPTTGLYVIRVGDIFPKRAGPAFGYRLRLRPPVNTFEMTFTAAVCNLNLGANATIKLAINRQGTLNQPIKIAVTGLPTGVKLAKDVIINPGQQTADLVLQSDKQAPIDVAYLTISGTALIPLTPFTAMPYPHTITAKWKDDPNITTVRLMNAIPTPFKITGDYELKLIPRGTVYVRKYKIDRGGYTGPIDIELADNQARHLQGVTGPKITIPANASEFDYPLSLPPWMETGRTSRTCVMGTATIVDGQGKKHVVNFSSREQNDQIIAVVEPERLSLKLDHITRRIVKDATAELTFTTLRGNGLSGPVTLTCQFSDNAMSVNPLTLMASEEKGRLIFKPTKPVTTTTTVTVIVRATINDEHGRPVTAEQPLTVYLEP